MLTYANGVPSMKTAEAIMTYFSKMWNLKYRQESLLPKITTSKYFSELKKGDEVSIPVEPTVTIREDYQVGQDLTVERINLTPQQLLIDQGAYFNVALNDVDAELSHLDLANRYMESALLAGIETVEKNVYTYLKGKAHASNRGVTAGAVSSAFDLGTAGDPHGVNTSNVVQTITSIGTVMAEQNADKEYAIIIPNWMRYLLLNSDLKNAMLMGDPQSALRTGLIGKLDKATIYASNWLPGVGSQANPSYIFAANKDAVVYTMRLQKTEKWRNGAFETLLQGLMVWGRGVVKTEGLVELVSYKAAEA